MALGVVPSGKKEVWSGAVADAAVVARVVPESRPHGVNAAAGLLAHYRRTELRQA